MMTDYLHLIYIYKGKGQRLEVKLVKLVGEVLGLVVGLMKLLVALTTFSTLGTGTALAALGTLATLGTGTALTTLGTLTTLTAGRTLLIALGLLDEHTV